MTLRSLNLLAANRNIRDSVQVDWEDNGRVKLSRFNISGPIGIYLDRAQVSELRHVLNHHPENG